MRRCPILPRSSSPSKESVDCIVYEIQLMEMMSTEITYHVGNPVNNLILFFVLAKLGSTTIVSWPPLVFFYECDVFTSTSFLKSPLKNVTPSQGKFQAQQVEYTLSSSPVHLLFISLQAHMARYLRGRELNLCYFSLSHSTRLGILGADYRRFQRFNI